MHRIHEDKLAVSGIEAVEAADHRRLCEYVIFRHLQTAFVRMILRFPRKQVSGLIEFDMPAEYVADRPIFDERRNPLCARQLGLVIVDEKRRPGIRKSPENKRAVFLS